MKTVLLFSAKQQPPVQYHKLDTEAQTFLDTLIAVVVENLLSKKINTVYRLFVVEMSLLGFIFVMLHILFISWGSFSYLLDCEIQLT